ncbi:MAG: hypothetical protein ACXWQ5_15305, partial [Ktedonobacterales bacterium]
RPRGWRDATRDEALALLHIGVGYGGLSWKKVRTIVECIFTDWRGALYVYEDYVPAANKRENG